MQLLQRDELLEQLKSWQLGDLPAESIWRWALGLKEGDYSPADAVIQDVVDVLADIPQDLINICNITVHRASIWEIFSLDVSDFGPASGERRPKSCSTPSRPPKAAQQDKQRTCTQLT